jgi:hypothetical protein
MGFDNRGWFYRFLTGLGTGPFGDDGLLCLVRLRTAMLAEIVRLAINVDHGLVYALVMAELGRARDETPRADFSLENEAFGKAYRLLQVSTGLGPVVRILAQNL